MPQDWTAPAGGPTFDVALVRIRTTGQRDRVGSLVVNPGGPGGSGVEAAVYLAQQFPAEVMRRFDLVGFDPRGVGRSTTVKCFTDADLDQNFATDPDPVSQPAYDATVATWESKYFYKRARPSELDHNLTPALAVPDSPSYPSEHAATAKAAADVLAYFFPSEAQSFRTMAEQAGWSRVQAGLQYRVRAVSGIGVAQTGQVRVSAGTGGHRLA